MSAQADSTPPLPAPRRSRKLTVAVVLLALLPLVLPFPMYPLELLWIGPVITDKVLACASFDCPVALDWSRLACLFILGPSFLVALASILLGAIGMLRRRWRSTSSNHADLFVISMVVGTAWLLVLGYVLWVMLTVFIYL